MARTTIRFEFASHGFPLKDLRRALGLTQEEFAQVLDCDLRTAQRHEKGARGGLYKALSKISDAYDVSIDLHVSSLRPITVAVMNPSASTGCSTICLSLAGYLAKRNYKVCVLTAQEDICTLIQGRASTLPRVDYADVEDAKEITDVFEGPLRYDVVLIDCPRIEHGRDTWDTSRRPLLYKASEVADLILIPVQFSYPNLKLTPHPCFYRDMVEILTWRSQPNALFVMNQVPVPDDGEGLSTEECDRYNDNFERSLRDFLTQLNISGTSLAKTKIGSRAAYVEIGGAHYRSSSRTFHYDGTLPHDMSSSASNRAAKREIEQVWHEVAARLPSKRG